ncbi:MAG: TolB family protein [Actinomycetota bacterium]
MTLLRRTGIMATVVVAAISGGALPGRASGGGPGKGTIFFTVASRNGDSSHVFSVTPDGTDLRQVTHGRSNEGSPLVSPNGRKIAFGRGRKLWVTDAGGGHKHRLTGGHGAELAFAWSPDGRRIAYQTADRQGRGLLRTVTLNGHVRRLTKRRSVIGGVAWSPDGRHIAMSIEIDKNGNFELFTMDRRGSHKHRVTHDPGLDISPTWGPRGIVYEHASAHSPSSSLRLKRIGHKPVKFIHFKHARPELAQFSPDGSRVAFMRCLGTVCPLDAVRATGGGLHEIYPDDSTGGYAWAPDSRNVVISSERHKPPRDNELYVCRAGGGACDRLTRDRANEFAPSWGPK